MFGSLEFPFLAVALAFVLVWYSVRDFLGHLSDRRYYLDVARSASASPNDDTGAMAMCRIAMGVTMAFMLIKN